MSLINRARASRRHGSSAARSSNSGGVSGGLRQKLGEELAAMLERVGRKTYAAAMEQVKRAIGDSLMANKAVLTAALRQEFGRRGSKESCQAVSEWLDEIVGDVLTDVADEVYSELPEIAKTLVDMAPEEPVVGEDDEEEEDVDVDVEVDEEPEEEPEEADFESEPGDDLESVADELEDIKAQGMAQAAKLAANGHTDDAAYLRMVLEQL